MEIPVGDDIFVGDTEACVGDKRTLHVWRDDYPQNTCPRVETGNIGPDDVVIEYKDGEGFESSGISYEVLEAFFRKPGVVLIHCCTGQTCSPTLAIIGKAIRGCNIWRAQVMVIASLWTKHGITANLCVAPMQEIYTRYAGKES